MNKNYLDLEKNLYYNFNNSELLKLALIHKSYGNEHREYRKISNEKLELLGDAVLDLIITEYLYKKYTKSSEGELAKIKATVVSEPILADLSRSLGIGKFLQLGNGEEKTGGRNRNSLLCDAFESILGAIFIDSNYEEARKYIIKHMQSVIDNIEKNEDTIDYKTILQEYCQHRFKVIPTYALYSEEGPSHNKNFEIAVGVLDNISLELIEKKDILSLLLNSKFNAIGSGRNKKIAEQMAAKKLCKILEVPINETL